MSYKMTDSEFIEALEICNNHTNCRDCPIFNDYGLPDRLIYCPDFTEEKVLEILKRQKAEIERLQEENKSFADIGKMYSEIKAEAIKEFAEAFKVKFAKERYRDSYVIGDEMLDDFTKEMAGETE